MFFSGTSQSVNRGRADAGFVRLVGALQVHGGLGRHISCAVSLVMYFVFCLILQRAAKATEATS